MVTWMFQMWERGIELCQEIAQLYENELFDYEKLSFILVCTGAAFVCNSSKDFLKYI